MAADAQTRVQPLLSGYYRLVYEHAKANWADHDTTDMHRHNHALRVTAKAILRDLFLEAKRTGS